MIRQSRAHIGHKKTPSKINHARRVIDYDSVGQESIGFLIHVVVIVTVATRLLLWLVSDQSIACKQKSRDAGCI